MTYSLIALILLFLCADARTQCSSGNLVVVVNKSNPTDSLSLAQLRKLMLGDVRTWPDKKAVTLVSREASSNVFRCVLSSVVRMNDAEYRRYLMSAEYHGDGAVATKTVDSGRNAARVIAASPGAIAVVEASSLAEISGAVKVMRINGKQPGEAGYPL